MDILEERRRNDISNYIHKASNTARYDTTNKNICQ